MKRYLTIEKWQCGDKLNRKRTLFRLPSGVQKRRLLKLSNNRPLAAVCRQLSTVCKTSIWRMLLMKKFNVHEILNRWYERTPFTYVLSFCPLERSKAKSLKLCRVCHAIQKLTLLRSDPSWAVVVVSLTCGKAKAVVLTLKLRENRLSPNHVALQFHVFD